MLNSGIKKRSILTESKLSPVKDIFLGSMDEYSSLFINVLIHI